MHGNDIGGRAVARGADGHTPAHAVDVRAGARS
jgi:hypothetical protein